MKKLLYKTTALLTGAVMVLSSAGMAFAASGDETEDQQEKVEQSITGVQDSYRKLPGAKKFKLNAKSQSGQKVTFRTNHKSVATVTKSGVVRVHNYGKCTITLRAKGNAQYKPAVRRITISVVPKMVRWKDVYSPYSKTVRVVWKYNKKVSGYQIQISRQKDFGRILYSHAYKVKRSNGAYTDRTTFTGLYRKHKYYFRIRAYKRTSTGTVYSIWNNKSVKTK